MYIESLIGLLILFIFIIWFFWRKRSEKKMLKQYNNSKVKKEPVIQAIKNQYRNKIVEPIEEEDDEEIEEDVDDEDEEDKEIIMPPIKKKVDSGEKQLEEENKMLKGQLAVMQDLNALKDDALYRRQSLMLLERIAIALESENEEDEE